MLPCAGAPKPGAPVVCPTAQLPVLLPPVPVGLLPPVPAGLLPPVPAGLLPPVPPLPAGLVPPLPPVPAGLVPPVPLGPLELDPQAARTRAPATARTCVRASETEDMLTS